MSATIGIDELRVGMFIHLDLGWWAHPFALSSFVLQSQEQIDTLRRLGLNSLRWSPGKSLPIATAAVDATAPSASQAVPPASAPSPPVVAALGAAARPSTALERQREALQQCELQYGEAREACRAVLSQVIDAPEAARQVSRQLTRSLLDKMLDAGDMCVRSLANAVGDPMASHALNVTVLALLMGRCFGLPDDEMALLGEGALLHDIGKLELPERARHVEQLQDGAEQMLYRDHVAYGVALGQRMQLEPAAMSVLAEHHEMADASGFPQHLRGDRISLPARIVALVNHYDNLCNPLLPSTALTPHDALSQIFAHRSNQFDMTMLNAFIRMMGVYPAGSLVQLTDDRYASVVSVNSSRPLKPRVLVCDTRVPPAEALLVNLDQFHDLGIRRSLKPSQLPAAVRDYLQPRLRMDYFFEPLGAEQSPALQVRAA